jgi:hypothetical protein
MATFSKTLDNKIVQQITSLPTWGMVVICVLGPGTVYLSDSKTALESPGSGAQPQGLPYTQASTQPPAPLPFIGDLFAVADAPGTIVEFLILESGRGLSV